MEYHRAKIDHNSYEFITRQNLERISLRRDALRKLDLDLDKEARLDARECLFCFYMARPRIAGQAFTERPCGLCDKTIKHSNTAIGVICEACSDESGMCSHCGGDMNLKVRRKVVFSKEKCGG
jgi:hypothetical protein